MAEENRHTQFRKQPDSVEGELYDELLSRYERILVFAGQLQEKYNRQKLLVEKNESLEEERQRLSQMVALSESYIRLLEKALSSLGVLKDDGPIQAASPDDSYQI